jgi:hypothetical protein
MAQNRKPPLFKTPADYFSSIKPQTEAAGALARPRDQPEALSALKTNAFKHKPVQLFRLDLKKSAIDLHPVPLGRSSQLL